MKKKLWNFPPRRCQLQPNPRNNILSGLVGENTTLLFIRGFFLLQTPYYQKKSVPDAFSQILCRKVLEGI